MSIMDHEQLKSAVLSGYANLENNKQKVNDLNVFPVPDGDTGTNMSLTMQFAVKEVEAAVIKSVEDVALACSSGALMGARGNSGVILSQLLRGFSKACLGKETLDISQAAKAMQAASDMAYKAVMKPTEGTILTVAREMAEFAVANAEKYTSGRHFFADVIEKGKEALEKTPELLPVLKEAGVVDSGGCGLIYVCEGILAAMNGQPVKVNEADQKEVTAKFDAQVNSEITFSYCTEFLVRTDGKQQYQKGLIDKLIKLGDSLLVIEDANIIKIHVHTNEPWTAMKIAAGCGELSKIKIENMREQHNELFGEELANVQSQSVEYDSAHTDYVIISVSSGDGLSAILKDLGASYIVSGGQTMNPSTQDFLDIIEHTDADNYILMPNNKNIILAAQQTKAMTKKNVAVLETKNIPQAVSALISFDAFLPLEENIEAMSRAMECVTAGQITFAVRDTNINGKVIKEGDIIGIINSDIIACENSVEQAAFKLAGEMAKKDVEIISLYYGSEVNEQKAAKLKEKLEASFPDIDFEVFYGGQPLYYYIISAE